MFDTETKCAYFYIIGTRAGHKFLRIIHGHLARHSKVRELKYAVVKKLSLKLPLIIRKLLQVSDKTALAKNRMKSHGAPIRHSKCL